MKTPEQLKGAIRNIAKEKDLHAQEVLQIFMFERILERLSLSPYKKNFVLKGGLLISSMIGISERTTMDMDTTVRGIDMDEENIKKIVKEIFDIDIGDGQNISDNLSTFSSHIKNVLSILSEIDENSFVIMDELGSGTDPQEGMGIAIAILEKLLESKANFLVTTHYPEVKEYAGKNEGIENARMTFDKDTLKPTYKMVIGEAGESCAFYIADRLGMPSDMLNTAVNAAYGKEALNLYSFNNDKLSKSKSSGKIKRTKKTHKKYEISDMYKTGDSVIVFPEKKIGIVCEEINEKGVLRVQIAGKKIWINHKRVKLHVKAEELYPEDYDMSIVFDSVENRKVRHDMGRKYTTETIEY